MALYAIADTHLSFGDPHKTMAVFAGWEDYQERLETNWRRLIAPEDTVVIAGDVSWGMSLDQALADFAFLDRLPGEKLIFKGNHDYWWTTRRKMDAWFSENGLSTLRIVHNDAVVVDGMAVCGSRGWFFDDAGADDKVLLREAGRLRRSIEAAQETGCEPVVFLHYPPVYGDQTCPELMTVLRETGVRRCYYGHLHSYGTRGARERVVDGCRFRLISADSLGFSPLRIFPESEK